MKKEKIKYTAAIILNKGNWSEPQCGTKAQHKALIKKGIYYGFESMQEFLNAWPAYREKKIKVAPDGSINQVEAHWFFIFLRKNTPEQMHLMSTRG